MNACFQLSAIVARAVKLPKRKRLGSEIVWRETTNLTSLMNLPELLLSSEAEKSSRHTRVYADGWDQEDDYGLSGAAGFLGEKPCRC